ncbi:MAG: asparagine synthase (glutamine-hydrolyzing) [Coriobacteriales bacterium]|jgi:asparagine synthase (glutamine-hydrolysing)
MCGIVGFVAKTPDAENVLENMMKSIAHRGPDDEGSYFSGDAALGFRRLSIIDLDHGSQPMFNENHDVVVTFNGEIYNYKEVREDLISKGHVFSNNSDTEVLVHAYEEYGYDMVHHLRGMFAFVIWDDVNKRLFGARDFFGIKPFYYAEVDGGIIYASEIKAILKHPLYHKEFNEAALDEYLSFQYSVLPETMFKGIYRLEPGRYMVYENGKLTITRYFNPLPTPESGRTFEETVEEIKQTMHESVQAHMIADVEVGSLLSSGIDSSYIAALYPGDKTYTVGFETADNKYNEISYAMDTAKELGKSNTHRIISPTDYWDSIPLVMYYMDEPLADPSAVALFFLDKMVAEDVKVVLSGEGADEFFGGYNIYHEPLSLEGYQKMPKSLRKGLAGIANAIPGHWRGKSFLNRGAKDLSERFIGNANIFSVKERNRILKKVSNSTTPQDITKPHYSQVSDKDPVAQMQYIDDNFWLPGDILLKADKMSMAHSLESRVPFLDMKVFSLSRTLPLEHRLNGFTTKYALRTAANEVLPEKVAGKKKLGFPVPMRVWLKQDEYYNRVRLLFEGETARKFFRTEELVRLLDDHRDGKADNSRKIWTVYVFLIWYDVFFNEALSPEDIPTPVKLSDRKKAMAEKAAAAKTAAVSLGDGER